MNTRVPSCFIHFFGIRNSRSQDYSFPGTLVPMMELSFLGPFVRWNFRSQDYSFPGTFVPWTIRSLEPWPDGSRNVWFAQAYRTIRTGWFAQKRGWFAHWWWWFAQARFFVIAPCRELHLATKYIWDDVFSSYIALKCSVTDNWHECIDRDIHSVA